MEYSNYSGLVLHSSKIIYKTFITRCFYPPPPPKAHGSPLAGFKPTTNQMFTLLVHQHQVCPIITSNFTEDLKVKTCLASFVLVQRVVLRAAGRWQQWGLSVGDACRLQSQHVSTICSAWLPLTLKHRLDTNALLRQRRPAVCVWQKHDEWIKTATKNVQCMHIYNI